MAERQRSDNWSEAETAAMLNIMREFNIVEVLQYASRHSPVYKKVCALMAKRGFKRTVDQVKVKWHNLKTLHSRIKTRRKKGIAIPRFIFFDDMDDLLYNGHEPVHKMEEGAEGSPASTAKASSDEDKKPSVNAEVEYLIYEHLEDTLKPDLDSRNAPVRSQSPRKSTCKKRRINGERARANRNTSVNDSLTQHALFKKESLIELFTSINKDSQEFIAAEMEKQRSFEKEIMETNHSRMKASMDAMLQIFLASQSPPTLLCQPSRTSGEGDST